jgi:uncharacterized OsmC-like protein
MLKSRGINLSIKDIFQHQTIAQLAVQANKERNEQEPFTATRQIKQMIISDGDELDENVVETIL